MRPCSFVYAQLNAFKYCSPLLAHIKCFQVLLLNINNSSQHYSFVYTQLNGFKYSKWLNSSFWPIDGTLTDTVTLGQSGPKNNENEGVFHFSKAPD